VALRGKLGWVLAAGVFGVAPLSGCTTIIALQPPRGFLDFGYRGGEGREVRVMPFEDVRMRGECPGDVTPSGHVVKAEAMIPSEEEQLRCSQDPPRWFAERLATALRGAGYTVLAPNEPGRGDVLDVHGALRRLNVEVVGTSGTGIYEADVSLELYVSSISGLGARRGFFVTSSLSALWRTTFSKVGTLQERLDECSIRAVRDMTAAILSLTNRYPAMPIASLGSTPAASAVAESPPLPAGESANGATP
jgi:hypothetical protein